MIETPTNQNDNARNKARAAGHTNLNNLNISKKSFVQE